MNKKQLKQFDKYFGNIYFGDVPFREMREDIKQFISNLLKEERKEHFSSSKEIMNDLLKRAKKGELEELRREVEDYFKQQ